MNSNETNEVTKPEGSRRCSRRHLWKIPLFVIGITLIKSVLVMTLWNLLIPDLFHGPVLTYLQAVGITVLVKLLVGFGGPRGHHHGPPWARGPWKDLTPEEREKLRAGLANRCGR